MAYWKVAGAIVEAINTEGWGKILEIPKKRDQFGLGYQPSLGEKGFQTLKASGGQVLHIQETFKSASNIFGDQVAIMGEVACNEAMHDWVNQGILGEELNNLMSVKISNIFSLEK